MSKYTAFLDANIFYSGLLRDLFMELAVSDIFQAKWSEDIHREWINVSRFGLCCQIQRSNQVYHRNLFFRLLRQLMEYQDTYAS